MAETLSSTVGQNPHTGFSAELDAKTLVQISETHTETSEQSGRRPLSSVCVQIFNYSALKFAITNLWTSKNTHASIKYRVLAFLANHNEHSYISATSMLVFLARS